MWPKIGFLLLMSTLGMDIGKHSMFVVEGMEFEGNQKCSVIICGEAAALCKCVKENGPKEDSGSAFWTIGLPIIAGGKAVAAAPLVLTTVGFTSAGIASGSLAASMMSSAAAANGGGVAAGNWKGRKCDDICDHEAAALYMFVNEGWKENGPPVNNQKEDSGKFDDICGHEAAALCKCVNEGRKKNGPPVNNQKEDSGKCDHEAAALCKCVNEGRKEDSGSAFWTIGLPIIAGGAAVAAAPLVLTTAGFTSAGIAAGSYAASMMSTAAAANGGCVAAGSVVATLQSAGAAGIGAAGSAVVGGIAAGMTAGGQAIAKIMGEKKPENEPSQICL